MRCQLNRLQKGQMIDEWFPLSSHVPLKGIEPGSLRVRARYSVEKIMPEEEYSEFKEVCVGIKMVFPSVKCGSVSVNNSWVFIPPPAIDGLAERVPRHLRSGPCLWSRPHLIGQPPAEDLQAREGRSPSTQDPQRQGNQHGR